MLKRFLKGLGVAFACSYALASPQNTIFLNKQYNKKMASINQLRDEYGDNLPLETEDKFRYNHIIDVLTLDNAQINFNVYDLDNDNELLNYTLNINNNNALIRFFVGGWNQSTEQLNVPTTFAINGYENIISFNQTNKEIFISGADYLPYLTYYADLQQQGNNIDVKIKFENCLMLNSNSTEINLNQETFDRIDFDNWVGGYDKKIDNNLIPKINSILSSGIDTLLEYANNNGYSRGYDDGYRDGSRDNESAFNQGYELGIGDNIVPKNIIGWFRIVSRGIQSVLDIEILPYMKIGYIISIPIMFGLILFIIRLVRGD